MLTRENIVSVFEKMNLRLETDGDSFVHVTRGRYAPVLNLIISIDEDKNGATLIALSDETVTPENRSAVCELLNLIHGQNLWNMRFHLDENGKVLGIGKVQLWGKPFNEDQFGDVFYSLIVTVDRLHPCLVHLGTRQGDATGSVRQAFEKFFLAGPAVND